MRTIYMAGDPVPRSWFSKLDNVESVTFLHPCIVEETETTRTIRKAHPMLDGAMFFFKHFKDSDGVMTVEFDRETTIVWLDDFFKGSSEILIDSGGSDG
jgi:hypothetical protein